MLDGIRLLKTLVFCIIMYELVHCPEKWLKKLLSQKKNYVPKFLKQRDIGNFMSRSGQFKGSKKSWPPQNVP